VDVESQTSIQKIHYQSPTLDLPIGVHRAVSLVKFVVLEVLSLSVASGEEGRPEASGLFDRTDWIVDTVKNHQRTLKSGYV
jgi:hypothetical protein